MSDLINFQPGVPEMSHSQAGNRHVLKVSFDWWFILFSILLGLLFNLHPKALSHRIDTKCTSSLKAGKDKANLVKLYLILIEFSFYKLN